MKQLILDFELTGNCVTLLSGTYCKLLVRCAISRRMAASRCRLAIQTREPCLWKKYGSGCINLLRLMSHS